MKRSAIAFVLLVGFVSAQSKPKTPNTGAVESASAHADRAEAGRYHVIAVKAPGRSVSGSIEAYDELFLYDSTTGRVWRYEPSTNLGEKGDPDQISMDAYFSEVTVDSLHGSHMEEVKRMADYYNYLHQARVQAYCKDHPLGAYRSASTPPAEPGTDCQSFLRAHPIQ
jgi:hypothetical protein